METQGAAVLQRQRGSGDVLTPVGHDTLVAQLLALGVQPGGVLLVHTSFQAVRPLEHGPEGLIHALRTSLGPGGTLVMPSWAGDEDVPFDPASSPAAPDLGVVADTFWRMPGVVRSPHLQAFAACGPLAHTLTNGPLPLPPHVPGSPVGKVHDADGQVLLLGVGHDANTVLHLAELMAAVPYGVPRTCTVWEHGQPRRVAYRENDHCCALFSLADDWLRPLGLQQEGPVGHARARLMRARDVVTVAMERLKRDPLVFLHAAGSACQECNAARESLGHTGP